MTTRKVSRQRKPVISSSDEVFQKKMEKIVELQKGIQILKDRMALSKKDLIEHFESSPQLKQSKYMVDQYTVRYVDKKSTDGITQKLIVSGLVQYFKTKGVEDVSSAVTEVMSLIKNQRQSKVIPNIEIREIV
jgi:hypothetical protein